MTRLVLDTNALREGQFSSNALNHWISALGDGDVDLLIPEVVVWEWAEHAALAHASLVATVRDFKVDSSLISVPALPETIDKTELVSRIKRPIKRPAAIWSPDPATWEA